MVRSISTAMCALVFLGAMFGGLSYMTTGMDMAGNISGCPFMAHGEAICSMNVLDHLGSWQSTFLATVAPLMLFLSTFVAAIIIATVAPNLLARQRHRIPLLSKEFSERIYTFSYRPLQELFSNGILHPKLF